IEPRNLSSQRTDRRCWIDCSLEGKRETTPRPLRVWEVVCSNGGAGVVQVLVAQRARNANHRHPLRVLINFHQVFRITRKAHPPPKWIAVGPEMPSQPFVYDDHTGS